MIKVICVEGRFAPICICDICGERIIDARLALVFYPENAKDGQDRVKLMHVHKGECDRKAIASYGDEGGTDELSTHLIWLLNNLGYRGDDLRDLIDQVDNFGM